MTGAMDGTGRRRRCVDPGVERAGSGWGRSRSCAGFGVASASPCFASSSAHRAYSRSTSSRAASIALQRSWSAAGSVATAGSSTAAWAASRRLSASRIVRLHLLPLLLLFVGEALGLLGGLRRRPCDGGGLRRRAGRTGGRTPTGRSRRSTREFPWPSRARTTVETLSSRKRSWVTSTSAPGNSSRLSSSTSSVGDVEVVRRLVEDQQVGRPEHQAGDQDAGLLAAGEARDGGVELLGAEEEALGPGGDVDRAVLVDDRVPLGRQRPAQGDRLVERVAVLLEADGAQPVRPLDRAGVGLQRAVEEREQGRLAAAVRPQQAEAHARGELEVEVRGRSAGRRTTCVSPSATSSFLVLRSRGVEVDPGPGAGGGAGARLHLLQLGDHPVRLLDAPLGLGRPRLGAALQPLDLVAHLVGERGLVLGLVAQHLLALLEEVAVAPPAPGTGRRDSGGRAPARAR